MKKGKSKKKILAIVLCIVVVLLVVGDWALTVIIYNANFNQRFESYEPLTYYVEDFDGLHRTRYEFASDKGQTLVGYMYSAGENQRGIIVLAHGFGGGGHRYYMDCANYFAQRGYYVFAYDATGNDESEGEGVGGLPQGVVDLDHAITFLEESGNFPDLPIALFGHSWGGYSVCSVLTYHPEVKAVIACSGFNFSSDLLESEGKNQVGNAIYLMLPFAKLHEWIQYGDYASNTSMDGFSNSDAAVMIVHGSDDDVVPTQYGYDKYYEKYRDDPRFQFVRLDNEDHYYFNSEAYSEEFDKEFDKWLETLDYDYEADENEERFMKEKADYIHEHLDRARWSNTLDTELFQDFVDFYDETILK